MKMINELQLKEIYKMNIFEKIRIYKTSFHNLFAIQKSSTNKEKVGPLGLRSVSISFEISKKQLFCY